MFLLYVLFCFLLPPALAELCSFIVRIFRLYTFHPSSQHMPMTSPCCGAGKGENICVLRRRARAGFSPASPNKYSISFLFIYGNKNAGISQMPAVLIWFRSFLLYEGKHSHSSLLFLLRLLLCTWECLGTCPLNIKDRSRTGSSAENLPCDKGNIRTGSC